MNSTFGLRSQGFLNRKSVLHSVEWRPNDDVTPISNSSQFRIGVNSTATVGPKLDPGSLTLQPGAAPISSIAAGSPSLSEFANAALEMRSSASISGKCFQRMSDILVLRTQH